MKVMSRCRTKIVLIISLALILSVGAYLLLQTTRSDRTYFPDYSSVIGYYQNAKLLRHPTQEELELIPTLWPTKPPDENAATYYVQAVTLWRKTMSAIQGAVPPGSYGSEKPYAGNLAMLQEYLVGHEQAIKMVELGNQKEYTRFPLFMRRDPPVWNNNEPTAVNLYQMATVLADAGLLAEIEGRHEEALNYYLTCMKMGNNLCNSGATELIGGLLVLDLSQTCLQGIIVTDKLSDADLAKIANACEHSVRSSDDAYEALDALREYVDAYSQIVSKITPLYAIRDRLHMLQLQRKMKVVRIDSKRPIHEVLSERKDERINQYLMRIAKTNLRLQATQIRAAIMLYQRKNGSLPTKLSDLCAEFMSSVPIDPYSGRTMRYAIADGQWKVWSVGDDLNDDGGTMKSPRITDGPDYVFPSILDTNLQRAMRKN